MRFTSLIPLLLIAAIAGAAEVPDLPAVVKAVQDGLDHPALAVSGTITTTANGAPLSTTEFTGRFKRPGRWMITWKDTLGAGGPTSSGEVWGDGVTANLRSGSAVIQHGTDTEMIIAAATGISHSLAPWLHDLFLGQTGQILPPAATVAASDAGVVVTANPRDGFTIVTTVTKGLVSRIEQTIDSAKLPKMPPLALTDADLRKEIEATGGQATPERIAALRDALKDANAMMATMTLVSHATCSLTWTFDRQFDDQELVPEASNPDVK